MGNRVVISGGPGDTVENAVVITADSSFAGVEAEYAYIAGVCGERGTAWKLVSQTQFTGEDGKNFDEISVRLADGTTRNFYFAIDSFFGKL